MKLRMLLISLMGLGTAYPVMAQSWTSIQADGIHDPQIPAVSILQEPADAFSVLPKDDAGNQINWVVALRDGYIKPRSYLNKPIEDEILDTNVLLKETGDAYYVLFPHRPHTEWLACANCHDHIFKREAGATQFGMLDILQGKFCGQCHGAVSFPLTECKRCHSVNPDLVGR